MTDETQTQQPTERQLLEQRATQMNIAFHPNISTENLKARVQAKMEGTPDPTEIATGEMGAGSNVMDQDDSHFIEQAPQIQRAPSLQARAPVSNTRYELDQKIRREQIAEFTKMVRVQVVCLNPQKKDLPGEFFTVANRYLGTIKRFVPYGGDAMEHGWHIPQIIYEDLKQRKFNQVVVRKVAGKEQILQKLVPEYSIVVLDPLTPEELNDLRLKQAASHAIG